MSSKQVKLGTTNSAYLNDETELPRVKDVNRQNTNDKKIYDFEIILDKIGDLGKYQIVLILMVYWISIPTGFTAVASVFLQATPDYRCSLSLLDGQKADNYTEDQIKKLLLPDDDKCSRYNYNLSSCDSTLSCSQPSNVSSIPCDEGMWFDTSVYPSTATTEFDLVCDRRTLGSVVTSLYFVGILFGSFFGGNFIDRIGRVPVMLITEIVLIGVGIATSYSPNVVVFIILRFIIAFFVLPGYIASFVYVIEITGEKWRSFIGIMTNAGFALGYICLSGFAYKWRSWRDLQFAISFVPVPFLLFWFFIPESPRWLFSKGKNNKAIEISKTFATKNGNKLTNTTFERAAKNGEKLKVVSKLSKNYSPIELFKRPYMRKVTINLMFNWFVNSLVYYGLSLNSGSLAGTDFLNNTLSGIVELVCYVVLAFTIDKISRKKSLGYFLLIGGVACLVSTVLKHYSGNRTSLINSATAFALIGKMAISASFAIVYNYSAELYPTSVRSTGMGVVSMASRIGGIITPFTLQLQLTIPWLTSVIFGIFAIAAGFFSFFLPETKGRRLPTTIEEAEEFYKGKLMSDITNDENELKNDEKGSTRF